jgi:dihydrofolate reductase
VVSSLTQAILAASQQGCEKAFVIGGGQVYRAALPICDEALITMVDAPALVGDTFFPLELLNDMALVSRSSFKRDRDNEFDTTFERWIR